MENVAKEICAAGIADADTLADIGRRSFTAAYKDHCSADDLAAHLRQYFSADAIRSEMLDAGHEYLLATVGGKAAGLGKFRDAPCPQHPDSAPALELQQLYVLPEMQRHGLGRRLLQPVIKTATERGAAGVWLSVWEFADWAIAFYRKNGFSKIGTVDFRLGTVLFTDWLMWLPVEKTSPRSGA